MNKNLKPIQFLLHQLATNKQDRERFNLVNPEIQVYQNYSINYKIKFSFGNEKALHFNAFEDYKKTAIINICLSRTTPKIGEAVLGVFDKQQKPTTNNLSLAFNWCFWFGYKYNEAISTLHDKMLELVPEYHVFISLLVRSLVLDQWLQCQVLN